MSNYKEILASSIWFSDIPEKLQQAMFDNMRIKHLKAGQQLHAKGEQGVGFYGVCEGRLRVVSVGIDGREMLFALLGPGTWFGEISMFDDLPRTHDNFCETDCTVAIIQKKPFKALLEKHPELYPHFTRLLCTRVRSAFQFIDSSAGLSLKHQLVKRLLMLTTSYGQHLPRHDTITLTLSQESLAQMINSSRQTVNQLLGELQEEGLLKRHYGKLTIPDPDLLFRQYQFI
ncbi:Crp/Fnr family transcriptional regulator [Alteromonas sp. McT4-15]|jgi:CRP-like cAMP-binding protein|uniref:Crp/Fnr family transcriptional regulator n=1 Tax=unclassified Alteromonas TaxID=2614992 RepID=UPI0012E4CB15|nr:MULTISPECIES: Crp/Fnr family transcriptional regulator [unclassified Alteromonas]MEC8232196.1 Crp/Fnr family transcriptional regulator [Pseudomonadota bacterium]GFD89717.1 Crp/Fnr family transcriptional regulator [Tenacibaculum sp. KUL152]MCB4436768.1 Crp/Fnr family transcriptional regulator [Alteromonas sp. McT4-15]WDT84763.1 Crp/Fnr family transcriptional regulator [Alteromonas sp. 009811495]BCO19640.1 Crp/Fnr family transcriptional regulator [Alteromonas sp. KC3]